MGQKYLMKKCIGRGDCFSGVHLRVVLADLHLTKEHENLVLQASMFEVHGDQISGLYCFPIRRYDALNGDPRNGAIGKLHQHW